jgi:beta-lactamase class D
MTHEEARERLLDLAYGELEPVDRLQVEQHVSGCAGCAAELEGMARTRAAAGLLPDPDPPRGRAELLDAARRAVAGMARPGRARWARPVGWMAVAAAILAVGGVTVRLLDGNPRRVAVPDLVAGGAPAERSTGNAPIAPSPRAVPAPPEAPVPVPAPAAAPGALASRERMAAPAPDAKKARDVAEAAGARAELAREAQPFPPGTSGAFVSLDLRTGARFRVNPAGCATRFTPFSTFEIPGSLIGLETGVVKDPDEAWQQGQSLRTALARSIAWYFGELATRVGEPRMKKWLATFDYGNQDVSGGLDRFWLGRSLRISPDEQVAFLARLQRGEFPVARLHLELVKEVLAQDPEAGYRLVAKTGSSADGEGWLVGWVESPGGGCVFALHLRSPTFDEVARIRPGLARDLLRQAGCIPP